MSKNAKLLKSAGLGFAATAGLFCVGLLGCVAYGVKTGSIENPFKKKDAAIEVEIISEETEAEAAEEEVSAVEEETPALEEEAPAETVEEPVAEETEE